MANTSPSSLCTSRPPRRWNAGVRAVVSLVLLFGVACASSSSNRRGSGTGLPQLTIESAAVFRLRPTTLGPAETTAELAVRYAYPDGRPVEGAPIDFNIVGQAGGATLDLERVSTTADGRASVILTAGDNNADFTVDATPPVNAATETKTFTITVTDLQIGSLELTIGYGGDKVLGEYIPYVFEDVACAELGLQNLPRNPVNTPTDNAVASILDPVAIAGLPAATDYVVAVVGLENNIPAAFGCAEGVEVVDQVEPTMASVFLTDAEFQMQFQGTYDLYNKLDFSNSLPPTTRSVVRILSELGDDDSYSGNRTSEAWGMDPGAFAVDLVMRMTCDWDHDYGDIEKIYTKDFRKWNGAKADFYGGCGVWEYVHVAGQKVVNRAIDRWISFGQLAKQLLQVASDLARAVTDAQVTSILKLAPKDEFEKIPFAHLWAFWTVETSGLGSGQRMQREFDMKDAGIKEVSQNGLATVTGSTLQLPAHTFEVQIGRFIRHVYRKGILPAYGYTSTGHLFRRWIDCAAFGNSLSDPDSLITPSEWASLCVAGLDLVGDIVEASLEASLDIATLITLQGGVLGMQPEPLNHIATLLRQGAWSGSWDEKGENRKIGGEFKGALRLTERGIPSTTNNNMGAQ